MLARVRAVAKGLIGLGVGGLLVNDGDIRPQLGNLFLEAAGAVNLAVGTQLIHGDAYGAVLRQDLCQLFSLKAAKLGFVNTDLSPNQGVAGGNHIHAE